MAQAAPAINPSMLRRLEVRCAKIRELACQLDLKCWNVERMIERLGMEPCDRDTRRVKMAYGYVKQWPDEVELRIKSVAAG